MARHARPLAEQIGSELMLRWNSWLSRAVGDDTAVIGTMITRNHGRRYDVGYPRFEFFIQRDGKTCLVVVKELDEDPEH